MKTSFLSYASLIALFFTTSCNRQEIQGPSYLLSTEEKEWVKTSDDNLPTIFKNINGDSIVLKKKENRGGEMNEVNCKDNRHCVKTTISWASAGFEASEPSQRESYDFYAEKTEKHTQFRLSFSSPNPFQERFSIFCLIENNQLFPDRLYHTNRTLVINQMDSLELLGKKFYNVYQFYYKGDPETYYFTKTQKIVAYRINKEELWVKQ